MKHSVWRHNPSVYNYRKRFAAFERCRRATPAALSAPYRRAAPFDLRGSAPLYDSARRCEGFQKSNDNREVFFVDIKTAEREGRAHNRRIILGGVPALRKIVETSSGFDFPGLPSAMQMPFTTGGTFSTTAGAAGRRHQSPASAVPGPASRLYGQYAARTMTAFDCLFV